MADTESKQKVRVLPGGILRVYNEYDKYRIPQTQFGFREYREGESVELPGWMAEHVLKAGTNSPTGSYRAFAMPDAGDEEDYEVRGYREDVSPNPERDFGTTTVAGELVSDPDGELKEQREKARADELAPVSKREKTSRASTPVQSQSQHPAQGQPADKR